MSLFFVFVFGLPSKQHTHITPPLTSVYLSHLLWPLPLLPFPQMESSTQSGVSWHSDISGSSFLKGLVTSGTTIGAFLGSLVVFTVADKIGRLKELQIGATCYAIGAVGQLSSSSSASPAFGLALLVLFRVIFGIGIGFSMHGAPTYIAEMAPPNLRGLLVSLKEAFIVIGILLGFVVGYVLCSDNSPYIVEGGWKWAYGSSIIFSTLMLLGTLYIPRSARWLLLKQRDEEVSVVLSNVLCLMSFVLCPYPSSIVHRSKFCFLSFY